jgi:hypothetical protein
MMNRPDHRSRTSSTPAAPRPLESENVFFPSLIHFDAFFPDERIFGGGIPIDFGRLHWMHPPLSLSPAENRSGSAPLVSSRRPSPPPPPPPQTARCRSLVATQFSFASRQSSKTAEQRGLRSVRAISRGRRFSINEYWGDKVVRSKTTASGNFLIRLL